MTALKASENHLHKAKSLDRHDESLQLPTLDRRRQIPIHAAKSNEKTAVSTAKIPLRSEIAQHDPPKASKYHSDGIKNINYKNGPMKTGAMGMLLN